MVVALRLYNVLIKVLTVSSKKYSPVENWSLAPGYYAPAPVGEAGALGGHRRPSSVRLSV